MIPRRTGPVGTPVSAATSTDHPLPSFGHRVEHRLGEAVAVVGHVGSYLRALGRAADPAVGRVGGKIRVVEAALGAGTEARQTTRPGGGGVSGGRRSERDVGAAPGVARRSEEASVDATHDGFAAAALTPVGLAPVRRRATSLPIHEAGRRGNRG